MTVRLDHTIVHARDPRESAEFLARILGLRVGAPTPPFIPLELANGVTLDYAQADHDGYGTHYAFTVSTAEFDAALDRLAAEDVQIYAHPNRSGAGQLAHRADGRACYFEEPSGHFMEIMERVG